MADNWNDKDTYIIDKSKVKQSDDNFFQDFIDSARAWQWPVTYASKTKQDAIGDLKRNALSADKLNNKEYDYSNSIITQALATMDSDYKAYRDKAVVYVVNGDVDALKNMIVSLSQKANSLYGPNSVSFKDDKSVNGVKVKFNNKEAEKSAEGRAIKLILYGSPDAKTEGLGVFNAVSGIGIFDTPNEDLNGDGKVDYNDHANTSSFIRQAQAREEKQMDKVYRSVGGYSNAGRAANVNKINNVMNNPKDWKGAVRDLAAFTAKYNIADALGVKDNQATEQAITAQITIVKKNIIWYDYYVTAYYNYIIEYSKQLTASQRRNEYIQKEVQKARAYLQNPTKAVTNDTYNSDTDGENGYGWIPYT